MTRLRWRLADDDGGQGALFEQEVERHVGRGEFRGLEFLHVRAGRVVNEVPKSSRMPFRWTINAYRGCSHACSYCLAGETPVLMADGRLKPIADLRAGDEVVGTERRGASRRYTATSVLDHWSTTRAAYRTSLEDGTALVSSGDHRFLTDRGWKHVTGREHGAPRPHLTPSDSLLGTGRVTEPPTPEADGQGHRSGTVRGDVRIGVLAGPPVTGRAVDRTGARRVVAVEALGIVRPMFDITTGTGDFIADGVISHNCFARPTHEYLGMNTGEDFDRRIVVKINAVERVRAELSPSRWAGDHIAMGTNTDPYQRCEGKYRLTQGIVGELSAAANPFSILTKSTLILRDIDLLAEAARRTDVRANFSIGTLDEEVWRMSEPGTPHPLRRLEAVARLNEAGVPCGVLVAPVLPGLSDAPAQLDAVVKACVEAGARSITPLLLHLRPGVREHYLDWLAEARPDLLDRYAALYPRAYAPGRTQDELSALVRALVDRYGGRSAGPRQARSVPPTPTAPAPPTVSQLGLGI
jgi:DNA repair photolyase